MGKIVVITNPMPSTNKSLAVTVNKLLSIIIAVGSRVEVITANASDIIVDERITTHNTPYNRDCGKFIRRLSYVGVQMMMFIDTFRHIKRRDEVLFWVGDKMILPYIAAKLKGGIINYFIYGNVGNEGRRTGFTRCSEKLIIWMANHAEYVCVETMSVADQWNINKNKKMREIHLFVDDFNITAVKTDTVGMVCRLTEGKHIIECIEGFTAFADKHSGWDMQIIGSGSLEDTCHDRISNLEMTEYIKMLGWVNHDEVPLISVKWKILLFVTDAEGLPNGLIETMRLEVPAIASPVGGINDVVRHGENGWILSDYSPESIEIALEEASSCKNYDEIAKNAKDTILKKYTFTAAVEDFKKQMGMQK